MMLNKKSQKIYLLSLVLGFIILIGTAASAAELTDIFDSKFNYDIYLLASDGSYTIIKGVEILRVQEILGQTYIVIRSGEFSLSKAEGFVLFDAIVAIIPSRKIKVERSYRLKTK